MIRTVLNFLLRADKKHDELLSEIERQRDINRKTIDILRELEKQQSILGDESWFDCECTEMPPVSHVTKIPVPKTQKYIVRGNEIVMKNA